MCDAVLNDSRAPLRGARVLLVEDFTQLRSLLTHALGTVGARVRAFGNPQHAVDEVASMPPGWDLLITDVDLPQFSGFELSRGLRVSDPRLPVLFVSGRSHDIPADLRSHSAMLPKPFGWEAFFDASARLIRGGRSQTAWRAVDHGPRTPLHPNQPRE